MEEYCVHCEKPRAHILKKQPVDFVHKFLQIVCAVCGEITLRRKDEIPFEEFQFPVTQEP